MLVTEIDVKHYRKPQHRVESLFIERWSPRAMSGEELHEQELLSLFEAARWAPSSYNGQPWRFLYARRNGPHWDRFFNLLGEFNQQWCAKAAALIVIVSRNTFEHNGKPARTHSFDTGAAWMSLALQASRTGLVAHGMQGFDYEKVRHDLGVPDDYTVEAMAAVGRPGRKEDLPAALQEREQPSDRRPLGELLMEGGFGRNDATGGV